jgi:glycosyltransferase involved in cell wall biosynthesis
LLRLRISETEALTYVRHVIVTSGNTKRILARDFGVERSRITVIKPGTDRVAAAPERPPHDDAVALLAVGSLVPRKGYDILFRALARLRDLTWRLAVVGDPHRMPWMAKHVTADLEELDLKDRVTLHGAVPADRLSQFYFAADVFVLASRFEGYGMAYAEAIAHGLPVIGTRAGAIPRTVPKGAGILVPPEDVEALASALRLLIADPTERARLAAAARAAAAKLPTWRDAAKTFRRVVLACA